MTVAARRAIRGGAVAYAFVLAIVSLLPSGTGSLRGWDAAVSPRLSTSTWISRFVKRGAVINAERLGYSGSEILQLRVQDGVSWLGKSLRELDFPREAVIGAILQRGRVLTPTGDTVLAVGDEVVVFALPGGVTRAENFFAGGSA